jgi:hypothetical protein
MSLSMNVSARIAAVLLALLCAGSSLGQDDAPAPQPPPPPTAEEDTEREPETPPPATERPEVDDDEFIPTEELNPDAAVTFPVDI